MPKKRRKILPVEQPRAPTRSGAGGRELGTTNRTIGRRTARANIMDINQSEYNHRANHLNSNNVQTDNTKSKFSSTLRVEPRRDLPIRNLPQQNAAAKKSITSNEKIKLFPEKTGSLLSNGKYDFFKFKNCLNFILFL